MMLTKETKKKIVDEVVPAEMAKDFDYSPDGWVLIKVNGNDPHYRVFGSWSGGYLDGDAWRLNSGVTSVDQTESFYFFYGITGSIYRCHKDCYGRLGSYAHGKLQSICLNDMATVLEEPENIMSMEW